MPIRVGVKDECRMDRGPDQLIEADEQRRGAALRFRNAGADGAPAHK